MRHHQTIGHGGVACTCRRSVTAASMQVTPLLPVIARSLNAIPGQEPSTLVSLSRCCNQSLRPCTFREFSAPHLETAPAGLPSTAVLSGRCAADRLSTTSGTPRHLWPVIGARPGGAPLLGFGLKLVLVALHLGRRSLAASGFMLRPAAACSFIQCEAC